MEELGVFREGLKKVQDGCRITVLSITRQMFLDTKNIRDLDKTSGV